MGKIKRERQKFHISAEKGVESEPKEIVGLKPLTPLRTTENIFAGINIQLDNINKFEASPVEQKEPIEKATKSADAQEPTLVQSHAGNATTQPGVHLTKKEKMKQKHEMLMRKLDVTQQARLQRQRKKQKVTKSAKHLGQNVIALNGQIKSLLTPKAVESSQPKSTKSSNNIVPKNVFAIPSFKDDLPPLNSLFGTKKSNRNEKHKVTQSSKAISKKNFANNYNALKKLMKKSKEKLSK